MNTNSKLLLVSSLCLLAWGSPVWGAMDTSPSVNVTIEKHGTDAENIIPQQDQNAFITSQVRVAFRNVPGFMENKVMIKTDKGIVTLTGAVADENIKASLEKSAKSVAGVNSVKNDLKVEKK